VHPTHIAVAEAACGALKSLAALEAARLRSSRAVEACVYALRQHAPSPAVCAEACGAIANLSVGCAENGARAAAAGGAAAAVAAAERHSDSGEVAEAAAAALWALAGSGAEVCDVAVAEGAVQALVSAMERHPASLPLQCVACAAARHFTAQPRGAAALAAAGGGEAILAALRLHGSSAALQEVGCDALAELARSSPDSARAALRCGALEVVKAALLTRFPTHAGVQRAARGALDALSPARVPGAAGEEAAEGQLVARAACHPALQSDYLVGLQSRFVAWLGAQNSEWLDLAELVLTTDRSEWEAGLNTASIASPAPAAASGPPPP